MIDFVLLCTVSMFSYRDIDLLRIFIFIMHNTVEFINNNRMNVLLVILLVKLC